MIRNKLGKVKRYVSNILDNGALVLLYHRVISLQKDPQLLSVEPDHFYNHVAFLKKNYEVLTIENFYEILSKKQRFPKRSVILTFDDGYADNLKIALPILEALKAQALFYVSTGKLGTPYEMWWDDLERILLTNTYLPDNLDLVIRNSAYRFKLATESDRFVTYHQLHELMKYIRMTERDLVIKKIHEWANVGAEGRKEYLMMTNKQVHQMSLSASAVIGAHTHNHPALSILDYESQAEEMNTSKKQLERIIQKQVDHFSYPYGSKKDFNQSSIRAAKTTGFKMVCANYYGQVHRWTNMFAIPRILIRNWNVATFSQQVKTFVQY